MCNSERCQLLALNPDIKGTDQKGVYPQCLRPSGHKGPHLIQRPYSGAYIAWEYDFQSVPEDEDGCQDILIVKYDLMDQQEVRDLMSSSTRTGPSENVDHYFLGYVSK